MDEYIEGPRATFVPVHPLLVVFSPVTVKSGFKDWRDAADKAFVDPVAFGCFAIADYDLNCGRIELSGGLVSRLGGYTTERINLRGDKLVVVGHSRILVLFSHLEIL